jgi:hypothetical protein
MARPEPVRVLRDRNGGQHLVEQILRGAALQLDLRAQQHPVLQHRRGHGLHVVGRHVAARLAGRQCLRRLGQGDAPAGAHAEPQLGHRPRGGGDRDDVVEHRRGEVDLPRDRDHLEQVGRGHHRLQLVRGASLRAADHHLDLGVVRGVADRRPAHEPVELRLRQVVGAAVLDRVLGGDHAERPGHGVGHRVDGDLPLGHDLEQRRLRLGRGAVDLVGQHDVGEHRPGVEHELLVAGVVDQGAGDVAGQQVRGELDALHRPVDRLRDRLGQRRLAHPGHVVDEQVALGQHADQRRLHHVRLAAEERFDVACQL